MVRIAPVHMSTNPKTLWFDAKELDIAQGDGLVVSTARGTEFARAAGDVFEAAPEQISRLKSPLQPVLRIATEADEEAAREMQQKSRDALPVFKEFAAETEGNMRPIAVEYLLEGDKAVFYFEAEERIDFRELVRKLASELHIRVDMRQIGVRDEARMVGGVGHCGQELCCRRLGGEFCPVSIRMAKEQDLSLNPQKISGLCGRLMCCLRYEYDAYKDFNKRAPKRNAMVDTPDGSAKVVDLNVPRELVSVCIEGEKPVSIPLADFEEPEEGKRPNAIEADAWYAALERSRMPFASTSAELFSNQLTAKDKLADPAAVRHTGAATSVEEKSGHSAKEDRGNGSSKSRRGGNARKGHGDSRKAKASAQSGRRDHAGAEHSFDEHGANSGGGTPARAHRRRRSTKLDAGHTNSENAKSQQLREAGAKDAGASAASSGRKKASGASRHAQGNKASQRPGRSGRNASNAQQSAVRPGQRSSGLRQAHSSASAASESDTAAKRQGNSRRRRRRNRASGAQSSGDKHSAQ